MEVTAGAGRPRETLTMGEQKETAGLTRSLGIDVARLRAVLERAGHLNRPLYVPQAAERDETLMSELAPGRAGVNREALADDASEDE